MVSSADINECQQNNCSLLGTVACRDQVASFTCHCNGGYTGTYCQTGEET